MLGKLSYIIAANTQPLRNDLNTAKASMKEADQQMNKSGKAIADSSKKMSSQAGNALAPMEQGLNAINPAAGQAVAGMRSASMGARALNAALGPIGIVIGLVGAAVAALTAYFKGSVEGQQRMAKIMAYIGGIADSIKDTFIDLGKWILLAFTNPREALSQLTDRFQGFIGMVTNGWEVIRQGARGVALAIKGIFDKDAREQSKLAFDQMEQGMDDFADSARQAWEGVKNVGKAIKGRANESMSLQDRENKLRMAQIASMEKIARLDAEIAAARLIANDESRDTLDQLAGINRAEELVNEKHAIREPMMREALAIQRERMALGHNAIEDLEKEAQLATELVNIETQRDSEARNLFRRKTAISNQAEAEHKAAMQAIADESKARQDALDAEMTARNSILEEIRKAGLTEVETLQEAMDEKLALHEWSEQERANITQHYQDQINEILEAGNDKQIEQVKALTEAFHNMGDTMVQGSVGIGKAFGKSAEAGRQATRDILDQMLSQIIAVLIQKIMTALPFPLNVVAATGAGVIAGGLMSQIPKMAMGGVIPPGYPNDSYPALLSSGETVTPPGKLPGGKLTARVSGSDLLFVLNNAQEEFEISF